MSRDVTVIIVDFQCLLDNVGNWTRHRRDMKPIETTPRLPPRGRPAQEVGWQCATATRVGVGSDRRGTAIGEETVELVETIKAEGAKRSSGGQKKLRVELRDRLIERFLRLARADQRSGRATSEWRTTKAIVNYAAEYTASPKAVCTRSWQRSTRPAHFQVPGRPIYSPGGTKTEVVSGNPSGVLRSSLRLRR